MKTLNAGVKSVFLSLLMSCASLPTSAVYVDGDGLGQALVFPYFTVQSTGSGGFNTYVSISNNKNETKVVKVRFREGRNSRQVAEFNLYLAPNDSWVAALVPDGQGARLTTPDLSCTNPPLPSAGLVFSSSLYSGGDDGAGTGLDRTREGHIDIIEMGLLTGAAATSVAHDFNSGQPANCAAVQGAAPNLGVIDAPSGGLSGAGTLINVANGMDITYNAVALANLTSSAMYSDPGQAGTDFDSPQVDAVSHIVDENTSYRLVWSRGVDAVSSVLMGYIDNDFVIDSRTASKTDWVLTFPTRRFYVTSSSYQPPFTAMFGTGFWSCEGLRHEAFNREGRPGFSWLGGPGPPTRACWSANAFSVRKVGDLPASEPRSDVFGSRNVLWFRVPGTFGDVTGFLPVPASYENGRIPVIVGGSYGLAALPSSTAVDLRTGAVTQSSFRLGGLPVTGFMARTFENGTLTCGTIVCQGNYSGSFVHRKKRVVARLP